MSIPSTHDISDLTKGEITNLTQLLCLVPGAQPTPQWLKEQATHLSSFPSSLLRSEALLSRIALTLHIGPQPALLCKDHKPLNPHLIRRIFFQISAESTTRLTRLVENSSQLPTNVLIFVKRLQSINSLWMAPSLYRVAFQVSPYDARFDRVESGCEACILASIGGNRQILSDLRASMVGRKKKYKPVLMLWRLVDAWIEWMSGKETIIEESENLGKEVRNLRRRFQKERRDMRIGSGEKSPVELIISQESALLETMAEIDGLEIDYDHAEKRRGEHDFENSVIDFYVNLMPSSILASSTELKENMHPAFANPVIYSPQSGTFHRPTEQQSEINHQYSKAYTESLYSTNDYTAHSMHGASVSNLTHNNSEGHAQTYRDLVEIQEEWKGMSTEASDRSKRRETRWSDFGRENGS